MNRFERVIQILDDAIGGPTASIPPTGRLAGTDP
jgi:hypothetical protein